MDNFYIYRTVLIQMYHGFAKYNSKEFVRSSKVLDIKFFLNRPADFIYLHGDIFLKNVLYEYSKNSNATKEQKSMAEKDHIQILLDNNSFFKYETE